MGTRPGHVCITYHIHTSSFPSLPLSSLPTFSFPSLPFLLSSALPSPALPFPVLPFPVLPFLSFPSPPLLLLSLPFLPSPPLLFQYLCIYHGNSGSSVVCRQRRRGRGEGRRYRRRRWCKRGCSPHKSGGRCSCRLAWVFCSWVAAHVPSTSSTVPRQPRNLVQNS